MTAKTTLPSALLTHLKSMMRMYKTLGEKAFAQVEDPQLFQCSNENSNSIAILAQHMSGNMKSRFTDFLSSDGEKVWRKRDEEFLEVLNSRAQMLATWEEGWSACLNTLDSLKPEDLMAVVTIREEEHFVFEAMNRQVAHYAYHVGQIIQLAKEYSTEWTSLSIPKNQSENFRPKFKS
jgi:hypothetical protein